MRNRNEHFSPIDIAEMSLTQMTDIRKESELNNLIYHYNSSRNESTEPCVYAYRTFSILHPDEGFKFAVHFEKRGETDDQTPPVVRFNTVTEVRTFVITLLALRKVKVLA
jgi:hypothetical protein